MIYPVVIALLIGFALSRGPSKPRVAFLNEVPASQSTFNAGQREDRRLKYARELFKRSSRSA